MTNDENPRAVCSLPDKDPQDWYIGRDGKQYPDDEWLTEAEKKVITKTVLRLEGESDEEHQARVDRAIRGREGDLKRRALQKRRHAKEDCRTCPIREACLEAGIENQERYGIWGGLYEEELQQLLTQIRRRRNPSFTN